MGRTEAHLPTGTPGRNAAAIHNVQKFSDGKSWSLPEHTRLTSRAHFQGSLAAPAGQRSEGHQTPKLGGGEDRDWQKGWQKGGR